MVICWAVIGWSLFLIMMIDIDQAVMTATVRSFADDTRLWKLINATHLTAAIATFVWLGKWKRHALQWWQLELMRYGKTEDKPIYHTPTGTVIKQKNTVRDFSILMSSVAKFEIHVKNTAAAGHRIAGWVLRTSKQESYNRCLRC